jgi:hypothetical protein
MKLRALCDPTPLPRTAVTMTRAAAITVYADYAASPLGDVYATIYAHGYGTREVHGSNVIDCQQAVLRAVSDLANSSGRHCTTVHTMNGDAQAFALAYYQAGGFSAESGWHDMSELDDDDQ